MPLGSSLPVSEGLVTTGTVHSPRVGTRALGEAELALQGTARGSPWSLGTVTPGCGVRWCLSGWDVRISPGHGGFGNTPFPSSSRLSEFIFCSPVEIGFSLISFLCCHIRRLWLSCLPPLPGALLFLLQTTPEATAESSVSFVSFIPPRSLLGPVQMLGDPTPLHRCLCSDGFQWSRKYDLQQQPGGMGTALVWRRDGARETWPWLSNAKNISVNRKELTCLWCPAEKLRLKMQL